MKYQDLFSLKNKIKIKSLDCRLLQIWLGSLRVNVWGIVDMFLFNYAPNFKEVGGAYCFWVVRPSVRPSRFLMHSITLKP